jgi:hypothetical protein
MNFLYDCD